MGYCPLQSSARSSSSPASQPACLPLRQQPACTWLLADPTPQALPHTPQAAQLTPAADQCSPATACSWAPTATSVLRALWPRQRPQPPQPLVALQPLEPATRRWRLGWRLGPGLTSPAVSAVHLVFHLPVPPVHPGLLVQWRRRRLELQRQLWGWGQPLLLEHALLWRRRQLGPQLTAASVGQARKLWQLAARALSLASGSAGRGVHPAPSRHPLSSRGAGDAHPTMPTVDLGRALLVSRITHALDPQPGDPLHLLAPIHQHLPAWLAGSAPPLC